MQCVVKFSICELYALGSRSDFRPVLICSDVMCITLLVSSHVVFSSMPFFYLGSMCFGSLGTVLICRPIRASTSGMLDIFHYHICKILKVLVHPVNELFFWSLFLFTKKKLHFLFKEKR